VSPGGRDPHRPEAVRAERGRHQPGCNGSRRSPRGAPRGVIEAPGVARRAAGRALGDRPLAELGRGRLADDHGPRRLQPPNGVRIGCLGFKRPRAAKCRGLSRQINVVLDRDRKPKQGQPLTGGQPPVGLRRLAERGLCAHTAEGIQHRLRSLDPLKRH